MATTAYTVAATITKNCIINCSPNNLQMLLLLLLTLLLLLYPLFALLYLNELGPGAGPPPAVDIWSSCPVLLLEVCSAHSYSSPAENYIFPMEDNGYFFKENEMN